MHLPLAPLSEIVERIPEMIFVKRAEDGSFVLVNQAAEELLGISRQEMLGKTDFDFFPPEEAEFFRQKDLEVLRGGHLVDIPKEPIHTRAGLRWLHTQKIPVGEGPDRYLVGISRDITAYVEAQEKVARTQQQLRQLAARLQQAQEDERQRLARELHDELGQVLTGVRIELAWLQQRLEERLDLASHVQAAQNLVESAMGTVRRVATALRPHVLADLGLRAGLDWLLQETCGRARLQSALVYQVEGKLGCELSLTVYRACQEALTNVVRHAQAQKVEVRVRREREAGDFLVCQVIDDGVGFASPREGSLGLLGMRERVQILGGSLDLAGNDPLPGTCVTIRLPIAD